MKPGSTLSALPPSPSLSLSLSLPYSLVPSSYIYISISSSEYMAMASRYTVEPHSPHQQPPQNDLGHMQLHQVRFMRTQ